MNNSKMEVPSVETPPILTKFFRKMQELQVAVSEGKQADFLALLDDNFRAYVSTHIENYKTVRDLEPVAKAKIIESSLLRIEYYLKDMQGEAESFFNLDEENSQIKNSIQQKLEEITNSNFLVDVDRTLAYTTHYTGEYAKKLAEVGLNAFPEEPYFCNPLVVKVLERLQSQGNKIVFLTSQTEIASQEVRKSLPRSLKEIQFINRDAFKKYLELMSQFCYPELYTNIPNSLKSEEYILKQISKIAPWIETVEDLKGVSQRFYEYFGNDIVKNNDRYECYFPMEESKSDELLYFFRQKFPSWFVPTDSLYNTYVIDDALEYENNAQTCFGADVHFPKENLIPYKFDQNSWQGAALDLIDDISQTCGAVMKNPHT